MADDKYFSNRGSQSSLPVKNVMNGPAIVPYKSFRAVVGIIPGCVNITNPKTMCTSAANLSSLITVIADSLFIMGGVLFYLKS